MYSNNKDNRIYVGKVRLNTVFFCDCTVNFPQNVDLQCINTEFTKILDKANSNLLSFNSNYYLFIYIKSVTLQFQRTKTDHGLLAR